MKRLTSLFLALLLLCCVLPQPARAYAQSGTNIFTDVPLDHWAASQIQYFVEQGIINGYQDGHFAPSEGVTREQFAKMMVLTFHADLVSAISPTFTDVPSNSWSYPYIETAKDFLTGYSSPFDGSMSFHPRQLATREDIAVALVRMLGLTSADAEDPNYASYRFTDHGDITPALLPYVSLAAERGLINGYSDGTFGPSKSITRAETVVLLDRATKTAVVEGTTGLQAETSVAYSDNGATAYVFVLAEEGAAVTVDGQTVDMRPAQEYAQAMGVDGSTYAGMKIGVYPYTFKVEGSKTFQIQVSKLGQSKSLTATAKYEVGAPRITITSCPTSVTKQEVTISGTVIDNAYGVSLTINGEAVSVGYGGSWRKTYTLQEGSNAFTFVATNAAGKTTTETRTIQCTINGPQLTITNCPTSVTQKEIEISGIVTDSNYGVSLTINGESVSIGYGGRWSKPFTLKEGDNTFTFAATNIAGKTTTATRTVKFSVGGPQLTITSCPTSVTQKEIEISGTVTDSNYGVSLTINGESVSIGYGGRWNKSFMLKEGDNIFTFVATNLAGKTATETRTVKFSVGGPQLTITNCPTSVTQKEIEISGTVTDSNYVVSLTINGEPVGIGYGGHWSKSFTLKEGSNDLSFVATNGAGKMTTDSRSVTFSASAPEILFYNCPESTTRDTITIEGVVEDEYDSLRLYLDDEAVSLSWNGNFQKSVYLTPGENHFSFRAVNSVGKETVVEKVIQYQTQQEGPEEPSDEDLDEDSEED